MIHRTACTGGIIVAGSPSSSCRQGPLTKVGVEVAALSDCASWDGGGGCSESPLEDEVLPVYAIDVAGRCDLIVWVLGGVVGEGKQGRPDDLVR